MSDKLDAFVCIGAGLMQIPMIRAAQKQFGLQVISTDGNPRAPGLKISDIGFVIDTMDIYSHMEILDKLRRKMRIVGVATCGADVGETVSACARALQLPGLECEIAKKAQQKHLMRHALSVSDLSDYMPIWHTLKVRGVSESQIHGQVLKIWNEMKEKTHNECGIVVKPLGQSASRGVTIVHDSQYLRDAIAKAVQLTKGEEILIEQALSGQEYSVEGIMDGYGFLLFFNVVERAFRYDNGIPMEIGHINPATLDDGDFSSIYNVYRGVAKVLGVEWGPFKIDMLMHNHKPYILETATRLSGGWDCQLTTPLSSGRMPVESMVALSCGMNVPSWYINARNNGHIYAACVGIFPKPGVVREISPYLENMHNHFLSNCQGSPHQLFNIDEHIEVRLSVDVGDVVHQYEHCAHRPGFVVATGRTQDAAWKRASELAKLASDMIITE